MAVYEIPLGPSPRRMRVQLSKTTYRLRFGYVDEAEGGWFMDINEDDGTPLVCGVPLVTGADLLEQYSYLGVPGRMYVLTTGDPGRAPGYADLGVASHLYYEPFA